MDLSNVDCQQTLNPTAGGSKSRNRMQETPTGELGRMLDGRLYRPADADLIAWRMRARRLTRLFNRSTEDETSRRLRLLAELFGELGPGVEIEPPFHCDYGFNIRAGRNLYANFGCVILDCNSVDIGDNVFLGPGVHIYAAYHPLDPELRTKGMELAGPVRIGDNVWIGGGAIICPGIEIGCGSTIGAGSVVTRSVPAGVVAAGNPCRMIRRLSNEVRQDEGQQDEMEMRDSNAKAVDYSSGSV
jgi:maltose O-acetyltransferase